MVLLLIAVTMLGACAQEKMDSGKPLPTGQYPLEFTSQMCGRELTRATSANIWDGGEEIALGVAGSDTKKYVVADKATGKITAASGVTPFYWTSTGETKTVSAYYPYELATANTITVSSAQNSAANYQASDALYAAPAPFAFVDETKQLAFRHLPANVRANLKAGEGVTAEEVGNATVRFVSQCLTAPFDNATGAVEAVRPGSSSVEPNTMATPESGFQQSVQALLLPCQMKDNKFIEVTLGNDKFYYTPTTETDGTLESGKGYTYVITVKRDGIEVVLQESSVWTEGVGEEIQSRGLMAFTINLAPYPSDKTYVLPFKDWDMTGTYTLTVNWGDGTTATIQPGTDLSTPISHPYAEAKEYTITISTTEEDFSSEQVPGFSPGGYRTANDNPQKLKSLLTPLLNTGEISFVGCFDGCSGLTTIPAGLFANNPEVTDFSFCFYGCTGLSGSIPAGLFDHNPKVTDFWSCFSGCSGLSGSIPAGLFDNNPQVTDFSSCFDGCSGLTTIPAGLFANNPEVTDFSFCFYVCTGLSGSIPAGLFDHNPKVTDFRSCFDGCSGLSGSIPAGLFDHNPEVTNFSDCFLDCSGLSGSIPAGLFDHNPEVTDFRSCFLDCSGLTTIPTGLFDYNPKVTDFRSCFFDCSGLSGSIPAGLFDHNPKVTTFSNCFSRCSGLSGSIPTGLFANNLKVTDFASCFLDCSGLTTIPTGLFDNNPEVTDFSGCFSGCSGLNGSIPAGLFDNNLKVTNFASCFQNCSKLTMNPNIFCEEATDKGTRFNTWRSVNFSRCFSSVGSDASVASAGTAPELWSYTYGGTTYKTGCFENVGKTTNTIDAGWK